MLIANFAIWVPRGLKGLAVYFTGEIIVFFKIMELHSYFYGEPSRDKKEFNGEKMTIIFPFLVNLKALFMRFEITWTSLVLSVIISASF